MNILIIGAGIHGCSMAVEFAKKGHSVTILEKNFDILGGTSFNTHNRIHLGYHYPRSKETIEECKEGYKVFLKNFDDCLKFPDFYYLIAKENSYLSSKEYENLLLDSDLKINKKSPEEKFINNNLIENSYITEEGCFNLNLIKEKFKKWFEQYNINVILNFMIEDLKIDEKTCYIISRDKEFKFDIDYLINCTYTNTNFIQKFFEPQEDLIKYKYEETEIVVVECDEEIPAMTIMDGPFITILPYMGHDNLYLIYDVVHSRLKITEGNQYNPTIKPVSNKDLILKRANDFFPIIKQSNYKYSLFASRPVPTKTTNDSRITRIIKHNSSIKCYSVLEGKFATAPYVAEKFVEKIEKEITILFK